MGSRSDMRSLPRTLEAFGVFPRNMFWLCVLYKDLDFGTLNPKP